MGVDVAVIGAGIAGLATAYELSRRGLSFVLLERAPRAGGVILSEHVDGYIIDGGPDALLAQKPEGIRLCNELGLGDRLVPTMPPRTAFVQRDGRLHALPPTSVLGIPTRLGPLVGTRLFSAKGKLRMAAELFVSPRRDGADESIGAFMNRRFGREAADYLAEPLLAGIHAGEVNRLSVGALFPRLVEAEREHGSLLRGFRAHGASGTAHAPTSTPQSPTPNPRSEGAFKSLPHGLSELVGALVQTLGPANVRTGNEVTEVAGRRSFVVRTTHGDAIQAAAVVLSTPAYVTADLLRDRDAELARLCDGIRYASTATVAIAFRREAVTHPLNGSGYVVPRREHNGILAVTWLSSKWPHRAPADAVLLRTFIGGARDPWALDEPDEELIARSLDAIRPVLGIAGDPLFTRIYRWDRASPQHDVGHLDRVAAIERCLARHPGLFVTGSGFRAVGIPDCIADARATGREVAEWLRMESTARVER